MRTKQTDKANKASAAGKAVDGSKIAPPTDIKSSAQPPEMSDKDCNKIKLWLDANPSPFTVSCAPTSRKRKRDGPAQVQDDLWESRLSVQYEVKPRDKWESLRRYKKFTVGSESIATGQCILVKQDDSEEAKINLANQWKAKVLEVRALDSEHVYIRVAWLNRPEDLDDGRQTWHGEHELIPTNQMDVIDAMAVNGSLDIVYWNDEDMERSLPSHDQYFWRQTYDFVGKSFSNRPAICTCSKPINPDKMIIQCTDENCRLWLHVKCIADKAATEHDKTSTKKANTPKKRNRPKNAAISADTTAVEDGESQKGKATAEVFIKGMPDGPNETPSAASEVVVTDADGQEHAEDLLCLKCSKQIKDDDD